MRAGIIAGVVSFLPYIGLGFFLWVLVAGAWSVSLYRKRAPLVETSGGIGWRLGALTGLIACAVYLGFYGVAIAFFRVGPELRDALLKSFADAAARSATPQSQQVLDFVQTPSGFATVVTLMVVFFVVIFLLFGGVGGAIGAATSRGRDAR